MKELRFNKNNSIKLEEVCMVQDYKLKALLGSTSRKFKVLKGKITKLSGLAFALKATILTLSEPGLFNEEWGHIPLQGYPTTYRMPNGEQYLEISKMTVPELKGAIKRVNKKLNILNKEKEIAFIFIEEIIREKEARATRHRTLALPNPVPVPLTGGSPVKREVHQSTKQWK